MGNRGKRTNRIWIRSCTAAALTSALAGCGVRFAVPELSDSTLTGILTGGTTNSSSSSGPVSTAILPSDRATIWNPGLNAVGGIPNRTTVFRTLSPSGGDDTATIQAALDACPDNQVVALSAGTFKVSSDGITIKKSNITLRGAGSASTVITQVDGANQPVINLGTRYYQMDYAVDLAANGAKGSNTVTLASVPSPALQAATSTVAGELVVVNQLTNPNVTVWSNRSPQGDGSRGWFGEYDRPVGQVLEVKSVSGKTITFTTPLHIDFSTSYSAHLIRYVQWTGGPVVQPVAYSGVEDLHVTKGGGGDGGGNIHYNASAYTWVKNVESDKSVGGSVVLEGTFRSVIRDSYIHSTSDPNPGGGGYGISINRYAADNLIENNISWSFNKLMVMRTTGGGNVVAYNYLQDGWGSGYPTAPEAGLNASHMTTAHYELFEGNEAPNFDGDAVWGNAVYITAFRNHMTSHRRAVGALATYTYNTGSCLLYYEDSQNRRAVGIPVGHHYYTFIGNVLGYAGMSTPAGKTACVGAPTGFQYEATYNMPGDKALMWAIGGSDAAFNNASDPLVASTLLRDGNYDYVSNAVAWDRSSQTLPNSLYLTQKPSFFGSSTWPWVNPTGSTKTYTLPARARFDIIQGLTAGGAD